MWTGRTLTALAALFFAFDAGIKLLDLPVAVEPTVQLGYAANMVVAIGAIEVACLIVYLIPRTAVLGAILLTGYLGGAVASHLRHGDGLFGYVLSPTYFAVLLWAGLWLRDARARAILGPTTPRAADSASRARV
jgi:hypothetical protein